MAYPRNRIYKVNIELVEKRAGVRNSPKLTISIKINRKNKIKTKTPIYSYKTDSDKIENYKNSFFLIRVILLFIGKMNLLYSNRCDLNFHYLRV